MSMKWRALLLQVLVVTLGFAGANGAVAVADVNDFRITSFRSEQWLDNGDAQGQLHIIETISVDFTDNNHGILRAIPNTYQSNRLELDVNFVNVDDKATQWETYQSGDNTVLKIGDPNTTITGRHSYKIDYTLHNVVTFYNDHDELYWDINGDQWQQPTDSVELVLHTPTGLTINQTKCFAGSFGAASSGNCQVTSGNEVINARATNLSANQTLTVVAAFPKGYFAEPTWQDWVRQYIWSIISVIVPPLLIGSWAFRRWLRDGKDLRGRGVVVPEYDIPDKLTPAEAATIYKYRLDSKDVSATIIDLAIRGYLKIVETTEKKMLAPDPKTYEFHLLNPDYSALKPHEQTIMKALFTNPTAGTVTKMKDLRGKFYKTIMSLQSELPSTLTEGGYFYKNPRTAGGVMYGIGAVLIFLGFVIHTFLGFGLVLAALLVLLFGRLMAKRTATGVTAKEHLEGLKLYLNTAEKDRINMLQSPDAPYAPHSSAPVRTVELFEKLLPIAIVLGVEKNWAKKFEDLNMRQPDWYGGNWTAFNSALLVSSLNNSVSAMNTSFSPPSSSGGSGLSGGGGFSGGGGGGGGGGGW